MLCKLSVIAAVISLASTPLIVAAQSPSPDVTTVMSNVSQPTKPACVSQPQSNSNTVNLGLRIAAVFMVMFVSILGAGFSTAAKRFSWLRVPPKIFFFTKHFGTGVLLATAFVHLMPTSFENLNNPCLPDLFTKHYPPLPGFISMCALFIIFAIELWMHDKLRLHHSHAGPCGLRMTPIQKTNDIVFHGTNVNSSQTCHQADGSMILNEFNSHPSSYDEKERNNLNSKPARDIEVPHDKSLNQSPPTSPSPTWDEAAYKKMSMDILLLEGGILFHSIFVGMTLSVTTDGFITLLIAILFHQIFEGLGLGSRIAAIPFDEHHARKVFTNNFSSFVSRLKPIILIILFGCTAPLGQVIGLVAQTSYDPNGKVALILVGTCNAISMGLLVYASLVDLLHADFLSEESDAALTGRQKFIAYIYVFLGAIGMSIVGAFA